MADDFITSLDAAGPLTGSEDLIVAQKSTTVRISAATISAQASDNSYNDSGNGFVAAGFAAGDRVCVEGFTGNTVNNIHLGILNTVAAGKITILSPEGDAIVDDAAGETVTISKWVTRRQTVSSLRGWTLVTEWLFDTDGAVATVEADVSGANEVLVEMHDVAHSLTAHRIVQVRTTGGGATYYTTSGEYADISTAGASTSQTGYYPHATANGAARSCTMIIRNVSGSKSPKTADMFTRAQTGSFKGDATAITHVRVGGVTGAGSTPSGTLQGSGAAIRIHTR